MLYPFTKGRLTGYVDEVGEVRLKPKFDAGGPFSGGVAEVSLKNARGFLDEGGRERFRVHGSVHHDAFGSDGLAYFARWDTALARQRAAFRDLTGAERALDYDDAASPREGRAVARRHRGDDATWCGSTSMRVMGDTTVGLWGFIDTAGRALVDERFVHARGFSEGRAAVCAALRGRLRWRFVDFDGSSVGKVTFDDLTDFADGFASGGVRDGAARDRTASLWDSRFELAWSLLDRDGKRAFGLSSRHPFAMRHGVSPACTGPGKWGVVSVTGRWLLEPTLGWIRPFEGDVAPAQDSSTSRWGLLCADGSWALEPCFEHMQSFDGPLVHATTRSSKSPGKSRYAYVNTNGEVVFEYEA